jgi:hypothetical protein
VLKIKHFPDVVGDGDTQNQEEEDDVIINGNDDRFPSASAVCKLPKDSGTGSGLIRFRIK